VNDGHFSALVTQGLAQVQLPAVSVHWPEARKLGLGAMLTVGLPIPCSADGAMVDVVVVGAGVDVVVGVGLGVPVPVFAVVVGAIVVVVVGVAAVMVDDFVDVDAERSTVDVGMKELS
jgi:hypothetical protein